jgi:archaetidylinositol phosphate synthase
MWLLSRWTGDQPARQPHDKQAPGQVCFMIDTKLRRIFQPIFDLLAWPLVRLHVKPDTITWAALLFGLAAAISLAAGYWIWSLVLLWMSGFFDVMDGTVARLAEQSARKGAYLDLVLDRMVEAAMIFAFAWAFPGTIYACLLFLTAVLFNFTTFIVAGALFQNEGGKSMHYDIGIAERTETFITFSLMMLFPAAQVAILLIFDGMIFLTGILRFVRISRRERTP